jgi:hypothetical protein
MKTITPAAKAHPSPEYRYTWTRELRGMFTGLMAPERYPAEGNNQPRLAVAPEGVFR